MAADASMQEPLLGGLSKDEEKAEKAEKLTRIRMASKAFRYAMPRSAPLVLRLVLCFVLVGCERVVHLSYPVLFKHMTNRFADISNIMQAAAQGGQSGGVLLACKHLLAGSGDITLWNAIFPWGVAWLGVYFLQGGSGTEGLLSDIRDLLWIPITQAAYRSVSLDVFQHLNELDHEFHLHRKTGQIMRILDRGTSSVQDTVEIVLFNVVPQLLDIVVACSYLTVFMDPWIALIVFITVASYVPITIIITERRGAIRKTMNALDNEREARATDMLLNYETVKYFCNEKFELRRYDEATRRYQSAEYWQLAFLAFLSLVQSTVVWVGLCAGLVVCVRGLVSGRLSSGDILLFVTMMQNLYVPLTYFGSYYRQVQKALIDMENLLELLARRPVIQDMPGAGTLRVTDGKLEFDRVGFAYNSVPVLRSVSFSVEGGRTLAVVGATGSGKSTILRLMLRFYDPQSGRVCIDGQDIRRVSQHSVRSCVAVVPQDSVLFNDTIMYNIAYGRPGATEEDIVAAAKVAHIHDAIMSFPKGYHTKVGERGLRLSGGEKQRVAFARAVVKNPRILILDEATSALDSLTELLIQSSLASMRTTCTTVLVAHRLSTILDADCIVVLDQGRVVESGTHWELLEHGGQYAAMWYRQNDGSLAHSSSMGLLHSFLSRHASQDVEALPGTSMHDTTPEASSRAYSPPLPENGAPCIVPEKPPVVTPPGLPRSPTPSAAGEENGHTPGNGLLRDNGDAPPIMYPPPHNAYQLQSSGPKGMSHRRSAQTKSEDTKSVQDSEVVSIATEVQESCSGEIVPQDYPSNGHSNGHPPIETSAGVTWNDSFPMAQQNKSSSCSAAGQTGNGAAVPKSQFRKGLKR